MLGRRVTAGAGDAKVLEIGKVSLRPWLADAPVGDGYEEMG
jgi:hypothetical protein